MNKEELQKAISSAKAKIAETDYKVLDEFSRYLVGKVSSIYPMSEISRITQWKELWKLEDQLEDANKADGTDQMPTDREEILEVIETDRYMLIEAIEAKLCGRPPYYKYKATWENLYRQLYKAEGLM